MSIRQFPHSLFFLLIVGLAACATTRHTGRDAPSRTLFMEPLHIGMKPDAELGLADFDAATLFQEGIHLHQAGSCNRALVFYDRLIQEFPGSRYLSATAYNAGQCLEESGRKQEAVQRYALITEQLPQSKDWVNAGFRQSMCLTDLGRPGEAAALLARLLEREDLSSSDRIDALVLRGEQLDAAGKPLEAEHSFRSALRLYRSRERDEYLDPHPAGRAEFRLSQMAEKRFQQAPLRLPEQQMKEDLEAKAQLLLEAQAGYLRTIRHGDPEWATAAGYRIGKLYLHLHRAMEEAPVPDDLGPEEAGVYRDLLRKRTAVLLRKALRVFEMTIELAERTRADNRHTRAVREEMARIEQRVLSLYEQLPAPEDP